MKKRIISLAAAVLLLTCALMPYASADYNNPRFPDSASVTFNGKSMTEFNGKVTLDENFQPGDDLKITITLINECDTASDWYMSNEVVTPFETATAQNGSYTYRLDYSGPDGSRTIFSSDGIGGDSSTGLQGSTGGLKNYFYLGKLGAYKTATVTLYVAIDGETQNNSYFRTLADVRMRFAVEKDGGNYIPKTAETGDMYIWGGVTLGCAALVGVLLVTESKRKGGAA